MPFQTVGVSLSFGGPVYSPAGIHSLMHHPKLISQPSPGSYLFVSLALIIWGL